MKKSLERTRRNCPRNKRTEDNIKMELPQIERQLIFYIKHGVYLCILISLYW